ncbi:helix-turn-helix domain-containing protein [Streptomyces chiangmaiensis]|uniref:helix-turn-helix domain-containing protein n=1 Tax=Streptomyces chiangmaiensis TaxID=766497 RepID=UPI003378EB33
MWFIKAGRILLPDKPIDPRCLTQDNRIVIADGAQAFRSAAAIAEEPGKHRSTIYRELHRGRWAEGGATPGGPTTRRSCADGGPRARSSAPVWHAGDDVLGSRG